MRRIAVVRLDSRLESGTIVRYIRDPAFDIPTTIDRFGNRLYAVNGHFATPPTPSTEYSIVRVAP